MKRILSISLVLFFIFCDIFSVNTNAVDAQEIDASLGESLQYTITNDSDSDMNCSIIIPNHYVKDEISDFTVNSHQSKTFNINLDYDYLMKNNIYMVGMYIVKTFSDYSHSSYDQVTFKFNKEDVYKAFVKESDIEPEYSLTSTDSVTYSDLIRYVLLFRFDKIVYLIFNSSCLIDDDTVYYCEGLKDKELDLQGEVKTNTLSNPTDVTFKIDTLKASWEGEDHCNADDNIKVIKKFNLDVNSNKDHKINFSTYLRAGKLNSTSFIVKKGNYVFLLVIASMLYYFVLYRLICLLLSHRSNLIKNDIFKVPVILTNRYDVKDINDDSIIIKDTFTNISYSIADNPRGHGIIVTSPHNNESVYLKHKKDLVHYFQK